MLKPINYEAEHRKLWNWLAVHPGANKHDYFLGTPYFDRPASCCFACEAVNTRCSRCPLGGAKILGCFSHQGLYADWRRETLESIVSGDPQHRRKCAALARQIAQLPWREVEVAGNEEEDDE